MNVIEIKMKFEGMCDMAGVPSDKLPASIALICPQFLCPRRLYPGGTYLPSSRRYDVLVELYKAFPSVNTHGGNPSGHPANHADFLSKGPAQNGACS